MAYNEKQIEKKAQIIYELYQLQEMDREMQKYLVTKNIDFPSRRTVTFYNYEQWFKDNGGLSKDGAVVYKENEPILYTELNNKLNQWQSWKGKKEFAIKKSAEELEKGIQGLNNKFKI